MKLTHKGKLMKKYSKPVIYTIDPNDPRISHLKTVFEQPKQEKNLIIDDLRSIK